MTKSLMLSIQPKHLANVLNGYKKLELRKTVPKDFKGWVYIYCTKAGGVLVDNTSWINYLIGNGFVEKDYTESPRFHTLKKLEQYMYGSVRNTKVVARFWFDEYTKSDNDVLVTIANETEWSSEETDTNELLKNACISIYDALEYSKGKDLYAWHIKKLEVFDKPKELSDFYRQLNYPNGEVITPNVCEFSPFDYDNDLETCLDSFRLKKAPQSYQFVYTKEE